MTIVIWFCSLVQHVKEIRVNAIYNVDDILLSWQRNVTSGWWFINDWHRDKIATTTTAETDSPPLEFQHQICIIHYTGLYSSVHELLHYMYIYGLLIYGMLWYAESKIIESNNPGGCFQLFGLRSSYIVI